MCVGEDQSSAHMAGLVVNVAKAVMNLADVGTAFKNNCPIEIFPKQLPFKYPSKLHSSFIALKFYLEAPQQNRNCSSVYLLFRRCFRSATVDLAQKFSLTLRRLKNNLVFSFAG